MFSGAFGVGVGGRCQNEKKNESIISTLSHKSILLSTCKLFKNLHYINGKTSVCSSSYGFQASSATWSQAHLFQGSLTATWTHMLR